MVVVSGRGYGGGPAKKPETEQSFKKSFSQKQSDTALTIAVSFWLKLDVSRLACDFVGRGC